MAVEAYSRSLAFVSYGAPALASLVGAGQAGHTRTRTVRRRGWHSTALPTTAVSAAVATAAVSSAVAAAAISAPDSSAFAATPVQLAGGHGKRPLVTRLTDDGAAAGVLQKLDTILTVDGATAEIGAVGVIELLKAAVGSTPLTVLRRRTVRARGAANAPPAAAAAARPAEPRAAAATNQPPLPATGGTASTRQDSARHGGFREFKDPLLESSFKDPRSLDERLNTAPAPAGTGQILGANGTPRSLSRV